MWPRASAFPVYWQFPFSSACRCATGKSVTDISNESIFLVFKGLELREEPLTKEAVCTFETSGPDYPAKQRRLPEEPNFQARGFENIKASIFFETCYDSMEGKAGRHCIATLRHIHALIGVQTTNPVIEEWKIYISLAYIYITVHKANVNTAKLGIWEWL